MVWTPHYAPCESNFNEHSPQKMNYTFYGSFFSYPLRLLFISTLFRDLHILCIGLDWLAFKCWHCVHIRFIYYVQYNNDYGLFFPECCCKQIVIHLFIDACICLHTDHHFTFQYFFEFISRMNVCMCVFLRLKDSSSDFRRFPVNKFNKYTYICICVLRILVIVFSQNSLFLDIHVSRWCVGK